MVGHVKGKTAAKSLIRVVDGTVNLAVLVLFLLLLTYGCYGLWDSHQIYQKAEAIQYEVYKPTQEDALSFDQLCQMNSEVFGWLTVYGTGIDYPLVQSEDSNDKYLNMDASGNYSLTGSLFLDFRNQSNFEDFNSIIYGHHMEKGAMFGDIGNFLDEEYFNSHKYGSLYYGGEEHGLEFWAAMQVNAYDLDVYQPAITGALARQDYINLIQEKAAQIRDIEITKKDKLILFSTCASQPTDGRHILIGRITDKTYPDTFAVQKEDSRTSFAVVDVQSLRKLLSGIPIWIWAVMGGMVFIFTLAAISKVRKYVKNKKIRNKGGEKHGSG